jgi:hypothetical protein
MALQYKGVPLYPLIHLSAVYRGPTKKLKVKEMKGS